MLIEDIVKDKKIKKVISFRGDCDLIDEFRSLAKKNNIKMINVFENAMKKAIEEIKALENEKK